MTDVRIQCRPLCTEIASNVTFSGFSFPLFRRTFKRFIHSLLPWHEQFLLWLSKGCLLPFSRLSEILKWWQPVTEEQEHQDFSKKRTRNKEQTVHFLESLVSLLLRQPFPTDYQFPGGFFSHNFRKTWKWGKALSLTSRLLHFPDICPLSATSYTLCFSAGSPTRSWWPSQWETWTGSWRCAAWTGTRSCRWSNGKLFIFFSSHEMHRQNCVSCHFLPFSKESDLAHFVLMVEL